MTGNAPAAKGACIQAVSIFEASLQCIIQSRGSVDSLRPNMQLTVTNNLGLSEADLKAREEGRIWLANLLYGQPTAGSSRPPGWFDKKDQHLRNVPAHLPVVQEVILRWANRGLGVLRSILCNGTMYLDLLSYDADLISWFRHLASNE